MFICESFYSLSSLLHENFLKQFFQNLLEHNWQHEFATNCHFVAIENSLTQTFHVCPIVLLCVRTFRTFTTVFLRQRAVSLCSLK